MPNPMLMDIATKSGLSLAEVEERFESAKRITAEDFGIPISDFEQKEWNHCKEILMILVGLKESVKRGLFNEFLNSPKRAREFIEEAVSPMKLKESLIGYVYNPDTLEIVAEVIGSSNRSIESYVYDNYDVDNEYGLTYSPAFGFSRGLIKSKNSKIINLIESKLKEATFKVGSKVSFWDGNHTVFGEVIETNNSEGTLLVKDNTGFHHKIGVWGTEDLKVTEDAQMSSSLGKRLKEEITDAQRAAIKKVSDKGNSLSFINASEMFPGKIYADFVTSQGNAITYIIDKDGNAQINEDAQMSSSLGNIATSPTGINRSKDLEIVEAKDGGWKTVMGKHIFIGKDGEIEKGPKNVVGMNAKDLGKDKKTDLTPDKKEGEKTDSEKKSNEVKLTPQHFDKAKAKMVKAVADEFQDQIQDIVYDVGNGENETEIANEVLNLMRGKGAGADPSITKLAKKASKLVADEFQDQIENIVFEDLADEPGFKDSFGTDEYDKHVQNISKEVLKSIREIKESVLKEEHIKVGDIVYWTEATADPESGPDMDSFDCMGGKVVSIGGSKAKVKIEDYEGSSMVKEVSLTNLHHNPKDCPMIESVKKLKEEEHKLIIHSLDDVDVECSAEDWHYVFTGQITKEDAQKEFEKHLKNLKKDEAIDGDVNSNTDVPYRTNGEKVEEAENKTVVYRDVDPNVGGGYPYYTVWKGQNSRIFSSIDQIRLDPEFSDWDGKVSEAIDGKVAPSTDVPYRKGGEKVEEGLFDFDNEEDYINAIKDEAIDGDVSPETDFPYRKNVEEVEKTEVNVDKAVMKALHGFHYNPDDEELISATIALLKKEGVEITPEIELKIKKIFENISKNKDSEIAIKEGAADYIDATKDAIMVGFDKQRIIKDLINRGLSQEDAKSIYDKALIKSNMNEDITPPVKPSDFKQDPPRDEKDADTKVEEVAKWMRENELIDIKKCEICGKEMDKWSKQSGIEYRVCKDCALKLDDPLKDPLSLLNK